jgi:hypothetical protein
MGLWALVCAVWLLAAGAAASQCTIHSGMPAKPAEASEQTIAAGEHPQIFIHTRNGNVQIATWDRDQIKLLILKEGPGKERLDAVKVQVEKKEDRVTLETDFPVNRGWFGVRSEDESYTQGDQQVKVHFALMVPRQARVPSVGSRCGNIELTGLSGETHAFAGNGSITAKALNGSARLNTGAGNLSAEFVNVSGWSSLRTQQGTVEIWIPAATNASLRMQTVNGRVRNDFGGTQIPKPVGEVATATLGAGGPEIYLFTTLGDVTVHRVAPPGAGPQQKKASKKK